MSELLNEMLSIPQMVASMKRRKNMILHPDVDTVLK